jgi:FkbH-like protein
MKTAVLSNINLDPLKSFEEFKDSYFSGYNQYFIELLNNDSKINREKFEVILFHLDGEEFFKEIIRDPIALKLRNDFIKKFNELLMILKSYLENNKNTLFIFSNFSINPFTITSHLETNFNYSITKFKNEINNRIYEFSIKYTNFRVLNWEKIINYYGYKNFYDLKYWYLGRIKYNNYSFHKLVNEYNSLINAYFGKVKKVLVLDLDNTLWGGIVGEDGIHGIQLSQEGIGRSYYDFQELIKNLSKLGILLAICSKNNLNDVTEVFKNHPMMVLKLEDFVSKKINWENKVVNLKKISEELDLSLDSFVFIDDNPIERELIKNFYKEVSVPDFPTNIESLTTWFLEEIIPAYFSKLYITEEDKTKTKQYISNIERKKLSENFSLKDFISHLNIKLKVYINDYRFISRTAQMTQKTNQFNLTTKRYTEKDIEQYLNSKNTYIFNLEYEDRFGNEGIIGVSIVNINNNTAIIDSFLMSCRVIGREIEYKFLLKILNFLKEKNIPDIKAMLIETTKNSLVKSFYNSCGFEILKQDPLIYYYSSKINLIIEYLEKKDLC